MQEGSYTFKADGNLFYLKEDMACWKSDFVYMPSLALHVRVLEKGKQNIQKRFKIFPFFKLHSNNKYLKLMNHYIANLG